MKLHNFASNSALLRMSYTATLRLNSNFLRQIQTFYVKFSHFTSNSANLRPIQPFNVKLDPTIPNQPMLGGIKVNSHI